MNNNSIRLLLYYINRVYFYLSSTEESTETLFVLRHSNFLKATELVSESKIQPEFLLCQLGHLTTALDITNILIIFVWTTASEAQKN